jgi:hypothetical protein
MDASQLAGLEDWCTHLGLEERQSGQHDHLRTQRERVGQRERERRVP